LITSPEARLVGRAIRTQVETMRAVVTPGQLAIASGPESRPVLAAESLALLQYTSGSTGTPKGVMLDHGNLLANIRAMGDAFGVTSTDVVVSWLPLYHDMGLIGTWLGSRLLERVSERQFVLLYKTVLTLIALRLVLVEAGAALGLA